MAGQIQGSSPVALSIRNLKKVFRGKGERISALDNVSIDVQEGELFTLLGPSGCGKTTTLRCIAGFEKPTGGMIDFLGRDFTTIPPFRRNIGMVFQSYALFPHMSVFENVAYGLKIRRGSRREIEQKVDGILQLVGLDTTKQRKPSELSGGQQQRIALARALVYDPQLLLLDEPLSNLDAKLRVYMRGEIRRIQQRAKVTTLFVTHDQEEALSISDRIAVMHAGKVSQIGTPDEIYEDPDSIRVADFIGQANFFECTVKKQASGLLVLTFPSGERISLNSTSAMLSDFPHPKGVLFSRPEQIKVTAEPGRPNTLKGKVKSILYLGSLVRYFIEVFGHTIPREVLVDEDRRIKGVREGDEVGVVLDEDDVRLFPPDQKDQLQKESS
jgi:ABC-type Fe3+/spermidine/putrescine transport system ATPase subunit